MTALNPTMYLVVRDYGSIGVGSQDVAPCYSVAYNQFAEAVDEGNAVAVFEIDINGNSPVSISDATDFFEADYMRLARLRGMPQTPATRFDSAVQFAAE